MRMRAYVSAVVACSWSFIAPSPAPGDDAPGPSGQLLVYAGTYTSGESEGIYVLRLDRRTGELTEPVLAARTVNPSFLALHPNGRFLYAVNETESFRGEKTGYVSAFSVDRSTGALELLNEEPSGGGAPCHLAVDRAGRNVLVANYSGGSVAVLRVVDDGRLGERTAHIQHRGSSVSPRQKAPHAHAIVLDAANRFAFASDLGFDKVLVYRFDPSAGTLAANEPPSVALPLRSGPRHFALHPSGRYAYSINELDSTVTALSLDRERGALRPLETLSTLPAGYDGRNSTAEVEVAPSGRFLYGSNRGHDSIAVFAIDREKGTLRLVEHEPTQGKTPRSFGIDPSGAFLLAANQGSGTIVVFRIGRDSGELEPTGHVGRVPSPVCVRFVELESR